MRISKVIFLCQFIFCNFLSSQQIALTSQYDQISSVQNPAYNGSNKNLRIDALSRVQWNNFPGTPTYTVLAVQTPINRDFALGAQFQSLSVGDFKYASPLNMSSYTLDFAYHKHVAENINISTGLRTGIFSFNLRLSQLISGAPDDILVAGNDYNFNSLCVGGGALIYGDQYYIGFALPRFSLVADQVVDNVNVGYNARTFFLFNAGYIHRISKKWEIKGTTQFRRYKGIPLQFDLTAFLIYQDRFTLGLGLRNSQSQYVISQIRVNDYFHLVYMFENGSIVNDKTNFYSQEFGLRYDINFNKQRLKVAPRNY